MTGVELATLIAWGAASVGFTLWGVTAYLGTWRFQRERMLLDPQGERHAGALWLGVLAVPVAVLLLLPGPEFSAAHVGALVGLAAPLVAVCALAFGRPQPLVRLLTPRWLLRARTGR